MSGPTALSFDEILKFMIAHNGKVTNHELVKHFKVFLMNPDMRDEARSTFKKHVNTLAVIKNQNNVKWLILKKKYLQESTKDTEDTIENRVPDSSIVSTFEQPPDINSEPPPYRPPPSLPLNQDLNILNTIIQDQNPSAISSPADESVHSIISESDEIFPPKVHQRRKSSAKNSHKFSDTVGKLMKQTSVPTDQHSIDENETLSETLTTSQSESMLVDNEQKISVKERKQMFNRLASESDVLKSNKMSLNLSIEEDDSVSLDQKGEAEPLDSKQKRWILCASRGEYHSLAKMCKENAKLVKTKDPFTTAMHWACKRGDENLVKLLAGVARHLVNERSGYTPLHIAMQFRHENVFRLLVEVYDADPNMRDWSGRKPRQYLVHMDTSLSPGSFRKIDLQYSRTCITPPTVKVIQHTNQTHSRQCSKKESFLRIGSLNVRVKKTTEAFSNFLGVGATRSSTYMPKLRDRDLDRKSDDSDNIHKSWGSADNIQKNEKLMPPPTSGKVKRRTATGRKGLAAHSRSTPTTPDQPRAQMGTTEEGDSDSDTAAGFNASWRQQRSSCT